MASNINIIVVSAPLPDGWEGTPDEFRQQIFSTLQFQASGAFLTGQIGGSTPTTDVGLFVDGPNLYTWDPEASAYQAINSQPIGTLLAYLGATVPDNRYLLCDGTDYLRADYATLFGVLGTTYGRGSDPSDRFRVPDLRGRAMFGAGIGDYDPKMLGAPGRMAEIALGEYGGKEWPVRKTSKHLNQPAANTTPGDGLIYSGSKNATYYTRAVPPYLGVNWLIRAK